MKNVEFKNYLIQYAIGKTNAYYADFEVFEITGHIYSEKGVEFDPPKPEYPGRRDCNKRVLETKKAARMIEGSIKWDGCSNLNLYPDEECMTHFCGRESATDLGEVLGKMYDLAAEIIPEWDGN